MKLNEIEISIDGPTRGTDWLQFVESSISETFPQRAVLRFVVTSSTRSQMKVEALILDGAEASELSLSANVFQVVPRPFENSSTFNTVLIIPTGIGAEIGGHAGDGGPVVRLLATICDTIVIHPNVVNASDINEMPDNALYVEGSALSRLLLGQIGLQSVRDNRVLVIVEEHRHEHIRSAVVNSVNAARATYGLKCPGIIRFSPAIKMAATYSPSGRAVGKIGDLSALLTMLHARRDDYDAIAVSSLIDVRNDNQYFEAGGELVNPWGGVEAMLTHTLTSLLNVPTAHAPMPETLPIARADARVVDPRMAAEAVSLTYLQCILKGLKRSPRIIPRPTLGLGAIFDVTNISCLITPDNCIGIPTLAALAQNIPVVAVKENRNLMKNDLRLLPWRPGQFHYAENYWEAAGIVAALKSGIDPASTRRPLKRLEESL